ncbi:cytochrome C, partial [Burkholderia sp. Ac-20349]|nr:cytochrome C [Burkholderia sp. Ac-20349]
MNDTVDTPRRRFAPLLLAAAALLAGHARADDATLGKTIATQGTTTGVAACIGCHGSQGEGNAAAGFPRMEGGEGA